jgi:hypothetical protein
MKLMLFVAVAGLAVGAGRPALADDPKFTYDSKDLVKDVKDPNAVVWTASAEAGAVFTTGNSETTNLAGGVHISRKTQYNLFAFDASGAYAKQGLRVLDDKNGNGLIDNDGEIVTQETISAETMMSKLRYDRFLTDSNSLFVAALASRDLPAGKDYAVGGQAGYSRQLYANVVDKKTVSELDGEFGYDFTEEQPTTGDGIAIHSLRAFFGYKGIMTEGTEVAASLEALTNLNRETLLTGQDGGAFQDTRVNLHLAITAKISKSLAAQFAYDAHYDNRPDPLPLKMLAPGFYPVADTLDTVMKASFIYNFF